MHKAKHHWKHDGWKKSSWWKKKDCWKQPEPDPKPDPEPDPDPDPEPEPEPRPDNAILFKISVTGAGPITAGYDNLPAGVASSIAMAKMDEASVFRYADRFELAGEKFDLPPALLAAISSRETRGGAWLDENGEGDNGNAVGIMQIDKRWHDPVDIGNDFASQGHIDQATSILKGFLSEAEEEYPAWSDATQLQAATAAYNGGPQVFEYGPGNFDAGTDGLDYSNDVIARAQYYATNWELLS